MVSSSTTHSNAVRTASCVAAYVQVQRGVLAGCVVRAPLVIGLSFVFDPTHGVPHGATSIFTAFRAAGAAQIQTFLWLNTLAVFLFAPSYIGLGIVAMRRSPWLATSGVISGFIGSLPWRSLSSQRR